MRREVLAFPITVLASLAVVDAVQNADIRGATVALVGAHIASAPEVCGHGESLNQVNRETV
jgi:hypothetical protein